MKGKYFKHSLAFMGILVACYGAYRWDKARKLDNYFVQQFCLDRQLQDCKGDFGHDGSLCEKAYREMKELGYNPYEIQQIYNQGNDLALKKMEKAEEYQEKWEAYKRKK